MASSPSPISQPPHMQTKPGNGNSTAVAIVSIVATVALSFLLVIALYYFYLRRKSQQKQSFSQMSQEFQISITQHMLPAMHVPHIEAQVFTYKQLHFATSNFSSANMIGCGGFGSVYRGVLPDGRVAAIKQLDIAGKQGDHEFRVEVDLLSRLHSPYLLDLIGYCADQDHRLLVYEYMPKGSLQEHLYLDGKSPNLDWGRRMRIALDAARGLEYLHELVNPPVIHRDFKTSNVLLDDNFNAKVSDFGLAKLGSDKINGLVSTRVLGTQGYVAPEYALTGHLTTKSDVYSFGVVLLELLTGRVPVDMKRSPGQGVLVSWALPRLTDRERVEDMVDPVLQGQYTLKELIQVAAIAKMCIQPEADYRPFMTDVVQSLPTEPHSQVAESSPNCRLKYQTSIPSCDRSITFMTCLPCAWKS
ncbi:hypothetical protein GOP47_0013264 [Adiantum capillus-veneris]|uniref:Protein kinase domain-containing protein n=1 Tax=Adiantum capillus-veneris TaxID=13818 RepID=A0A9D4UPF9_ADICA|nr:hypothetical protein GOP47_0013264 [Adiantum capillus-veneris]